MLCIAHIINMVSEVFQDHSDFKHTSDLIAMIKSSLFKKQAGKLLSRPYKSLYIPAFEKLDVEHSFSVCSI